jgi:hypothetical protein
LTGIVAGIVDPINLIPIGGTAYKAGKLGKIGLASLKTASAGFVSSVAQETILSSQQETRTPEESAMNIAAETILGGIIGGVGASLSKKQFKGFAKATEQDIHTDKSNIQLDPETQNVIDSTVGAKQYREIERLQLDQAYREHIEESLQTGKKAMTEEEFIAKNQSLVGTGGVITALSKTNPLLRVFTSKSTKAKETLQRLNTHNMLVAKNTLGVASQQSVENSVKQHRAGLGFSIRDGRKGFVDYKKRVQKEGLPKDLKNIVDFNTKVSEALRRGDVSDIPEVERVAKRYRKQVFEPLKKEAIELGLLPEDVKVETAVSYLTRQYNRRKIIAQEPVLRQRMTDKLINKVFPETDKIILNKQKNLNSMILDVDTDITRLESVFEKTRKELLEEAAGVERLSDDELFSILDSYLQAQKVQRTLKPKSLVQFIKENGGIFDESGQLASKDIRLQAPTVLRKNRLNSEGTEIDADNVALRAWEAGYFPEFQERPTINEFLDAITDELSGTKRFSDNDIDLVVRREEALKLIGDVEELGIDIDKLKKIKNLKEIEITKSDKLKKLLINREVELLRNKKRRLENRFNEEGQRFDAFLGNVESREQYAEDIVDGVLDKLKGVERNNVSMPYDLKITQRGPLKERTLNFMDDSELEDFLENDIEKIADGYTRVMGTDVEIQKEFGSLTLDNELAEIKTEYRELSKKATTEKEREAIVKEEKQVIRDLEAMRDIMRGMYGRPNDPDSLIVRGARISRQVQYLSKLGGVAISSIPDLARVVTVHGYGRVFGKGLKNVATNLKGIKLNVKEAQLAGNVLESVLNTRLATLAELTDPYGGGSKFERFLTNMSNSYSKVTGMTTWNDTMKGFTSVLTQQRVIDDSRKLLSGKIKKKDRTYLAFLGIDEEIAKKITKQLDKYAEIEGNLTVANTEKWVDETAARFFRNAINLDVDRTIITKNVGDTPIFMNTELGRTIGQFKSFTFASTQQALIAGLQQRDTAALQGLITAVGLGALVYNLKTIAAGKEPSSDPKKLIAEGLDRSGMLGIIMEINNISEKVSRGQVGINRLTGGEVMSRYASRNVLGSLIGPSAGTIQDTTSIIGAISTGEISQSDIRAFRRMTPYQNLFYTRWLFDRLEKSLNEKMGT